MREFEGYNPNPEAQQPPVASEEEKRIEESTERAAAKKPQQGREPKTNFDVPVENPSLKGQKSRILKAKLRDMTGQPQVKPMPTDFAEKTDFNNPNTIAIGKMKRRLEKIRNRLFPNKENPE
jgi:hypothetical protein